MYGVELYGLVCRMVMRDGLSHREAARRFGIDRGTVAKMVKHPVPPGYQRTAPVRRPKLAEHVDVIEQVLDADETAPAKQRHTARRIFERLRDERSFDGSYSTVRDHVRSRRQVRKEVFVPLAHPPGHARADFGEAVVVLGGVEQKVRFFVMDQPQSDAIFVKAYHGETAEAFCDGHVEAFAFFGGVPQSILFDNTKLAVAQILGDGTRKRSHLSAALQSRYLFDDRYGRPAKGSGKGAVEGMVGFARRTFMVPIPRPRDIDELNATLREPCMARRQAVLRGESETIAARPEKDRAVFTELPATAFDACDQRPGRVSSQALVRYRSSSEKKSIQWIDFSENDCSVPVACAHREVIVKGHVDEVVITAGSEEIARHRRSHGSADFVLDPLHDLSLLEEKVGALDQAAPLQGWELPPEFLTLRRLLEARLSSKNRCAAGKREFVQVLRLLETVPMETVHAAVRDALRLGAISSDAVRHLALARVEQRPVRLDTARYPHLPVARIGRTRAADYMALVTGRT